MNLTIRAIQILQTLNDRQHIGNLVSRNKSEDDGFVLESSLVALLPDKFVWWAVPTLP